MAPATIAEKATTTEHPRGLQFALRTIIGFAARYGLLTVIGVISSVPLLWMIATSLKEKGKEFRFPPELIPVPPVWENYIDVWPVTSLHLFFINSVFITVTATVGTVITASMVAFGFARIQFPGRNVLFILMLSTMMLPEIVTLVPQFVLFRILDWIDTPMPLIVPFWFGGGAFYIFLIRQFMLQLPKELDEAAFADGASYFRIYWNIVLPLAGPAMATVAIFSVVARWNDFSRAVNLSERRKVEAAGAGAASFSRGRAGRWNYGRYSPLEPAHGGQRGNASPDFAFVLFRAKVLRPGRRTDRSHRTLAQPTAP